MGASIDVALLAYGGPSSVAEVPDFLRTLARTEPDEAAVADVTKRYEAIGGGSPLPDITRRQAAALQAALVAQLGVATRVRPGFLYTAPTVADALEGLDRESVVALPMSPFSSTYTTATYRRALDDAGAAEVPLVDGWHADPRFLAAVGGRIGEALDGCDPAEFALLFTAHSLPLSAVEGGDPYVDQLHETVARLIGQVMPGDWRLGFQSKGRRGGDWLEPEADDVAAELADAGWKKLLVVPIGFVADHVETLYDLDIVLRERIETMGMSYRRTASLNDSPRFIEALADIVVDFLARRPVPDSVDLGSLPHFHGEGGGLAGDDGRDGGEPAAPGSGSPPGSDPGAPER